MNLASNQRFLLDTHIFLWIITDPAKISESLYERLRDPANEVFYSAVISWEISVKRASGRLHFSGQPVVVAKKTGLTVLPIEAEHSEAAAELPLIHRDPFDRLLIAQAMVEGLVLITQDRAIGRYGIPVLSP